MGQGAFLTAGQGLPKKAWYWLARAIEREGRELGDGSGFVVICTSCGAYGSAATKGLAAQCVGSAA